MVNHEDFFRTAPNPGSRQCPSCNGLRTERFDEACPCGETASPEMLDYRVSDWDWAQCPPDMVKLGDEWVSMRRCAHPGCEERTVVHEFECAEHGGEDSAAIRQSDEARAAQAATLFVVIYRTRGAQDDVIGVFRRDSLPVLEPDWEALEVLPDGRIRREGDWCPLKQRDKALGES